MKIWLIIFIFLPFLVKCGDQLPLRQARLLQIPSHLTNSLEITIDQESGLKRFTLKKELTHAFKGTYLIQLLGLFEKELAHLQPQLHQKAQIQVKMKVRAQVEKDYEFQLLSMYLQNDSNPEIYPENCPLNKCFRPNQDSNVPFSNITFKSSSVNINSLNHLNIYLRGDFYIQDMELSISRPL